MRTIKQIAVVLTCLLFSSCYTSRTVYLKTDNGNHRGWYKNSNNPHHPYTTNPGGNNGNKNNGHGNKK